MKKIKMLYDVARTMKNMAKIDGALSIDVRKDQEEVFSLQNRFNKDETGKVKAHVTSKMNLNGEDLSRESTTEFTMKGNHSPCMFLKPAHGPHRHGNSGPCGVRGVWHRISVALGVLSSLQVEKKPDGTTEISLKYSDIPDEIKTSLKERLLHKHADRPYSCSIQGCRDIELLNGLLVISVNENNTIDKMTVKLDGTAHDVDSRMHTMAATADVQFAW